MNGRTDRAVAAFVMSAAGDAAGWPYEFGWARPKSMEYVRFFEWTKRVGGKYWGFSEKIRAGSYSDDTQLTLAIARSIDQEGNFQPDYFAHLELPLWLHYERGGGKTLKTAARRLLGKKRNWYENFFHTKEVSYKTAGANGAAMRVIPLVIAANGGIQKLLRNVFQSSIVTHGHPRALLGAAVYASAAHYLLNLSNERFSRREFLSFIRNVIENGLIGAYGMKDWISQWEKEPPDLGKWEDVFNEVRSEANEYLDSIEKFLVKDERFYYQQVGALSRETRGSGLSTVFAAVFTFLKNLEFPWKGISKAATMVGADTDTIASFVGGMMGALYGTRSIPSFVWEVLQDRPYIETLARELVAIATHNDHISLIRVPYRSKQEILWKMAAWELGLREMFWDALEEGDYVNHPVLGRGRIIRKETQALPRPDYVAKILEVFFDCGQTCVFHSRVSVKGDISNTLLEEVKKNLEVEF